MSLADEMKLKAARHSGDGHYTALNALLDASRPRSLRRVVCEAEGRALLVHERTGITVLFEGHADKGQGIVDFDVVLYGLSYRFVDAVQGRQVPFDSGCEKFPVALRKGRLFTLRHMPDLMLRDEDQGWREAGATDANNVVQLPERRALRLAV